MIYLLFFFGWLFSALLIIAFFKGAYKVSWPEGEDGQDAQS